VDHDYNPSVTALLEYFVDNKIYVCKKTIYLNSVVEYGVHMVLSPCLDKYGMYKYMDACIKLFLYLFFTGIR